MESKDDLDTIYQIIRKGENFVHTNNNFAKFAHKFFIEQFKPYYFNPNKINEENYLIDDTYMDQVIKMNIGTIYSSITNNIIYRYDKYLNKFLKCYFMNMFTDEFKYNSLIKKCSTYEMYLKNYSNIQNNILELVKFNSSRILDLVNILKYEKEIYGNYDISTLSTLASKLVGKLSSHQIKRTENNIFNSDIKNIKRFEENFNTDKILVKNIIIGKNSRSDINKLHKEFKIIFTVIDKYYPEDIKSYADLSVMPFKFLNKMININNYLQENNYKTFNVFPTVTNLKPVHIALDTASIDNIFLKQENHDSIIQNRELIWKKVFKFPQSFFKLNNKYIFEGTVHTDGISVSLIYYSLKDNIEAVNIAKNKLNVRKRESEIKKNIFNEVKNKYKNILESIEKKILEFELTEKFYMDEIKKNSKNKKLLKDLIESTILIIYRLQQEYDDNIRIFINPEYNELYKKYKNKKEEDKKIKDKYYKEEYLKKQNLNKIELEKYKITDIDKYREIIRKNKEFYYLNDLIDTELNELKNTDKKLYIDQGKNELLYILNAYNGKFMHYSSKERYKALEIKKYKYNTENLMKKLGITYMNERIKDINKKTTNKEQIKINQLILNNENEKLYEKYLNTRLRKEKLQKYMTKQKSETLMIKKIMKQLGIKNLEELKTYTLMIGDWGGCNNLKNSKSTLGIGMKRILKKYFKNMYLIDETKTSLLSNITHEPTKESTIEIISYKNNDKKQLKIINKRIHGILTFNMEKKCITCKKLYNDLEEKNKKDNKIWIRRFIQRDKNAVLNFKYITEYYLNNNRERPEIFKRKKKINNT